MDAISIGAAGLNSATQRFDVSAQAVVGGDIVSGATDLISAKVDFQASAKVIKVADQMLGTLLDIKA